MHLSSPRRWQSSTLFSILMRMNSRHSFPHTHAELHFNERHSQWSVRDAMITSNSQRVESVQSQPNAFHLHFFIFFFFPPFSVWYVCSTLVQSPNHSIFIEARAIRTVSGVNNAVTSPMTQKASMTRVKSYVTFMRHHSLSHNKMAVSYCVQRAPHCIRT